MPLQQALLPEILGGVFSHLSTPDLKSCAVVNQSWSQEATRILWYSIKFELSTGDSYNMTRACEKFARFINT
ncbi:hypothetical protein DL93DRAFT_355135 [Clavulina sp. PMI_390]|nr:hypothetical protein DL93DRAFT_355135 [Clavulina sp. PMI_390]